MSAAATIEAAARGELPAWAEASDGRRAHIARVAALMDEWSQALALPEAERVRWRAAAYLHDALRNADPDTLRPLVPEALRDAPKALLHGPAAARRLADDGVDDAELLGAVAWHTLGNATLGRLGRALYVADFVEPGRAFEPAWRATLRARMPGALDAVTREVVASRIRHLLERDMPVRAETLGFWNVLAREAQA